MTDIDGVWCPHSRGNRDQLGAVTRDVLYLDDLDFPVFWLFSSLGAMSFGDTGNRWMRGEGRNGDGKGGVQSTGDLYDHCGVGGSLHGMF